MSVDIRNEKYILALAADLEAYVAGGNAGAGRYMSTDLTEAAEALRAFVASGKRMCDCGQAMVRDQRKCKWTCAACKVDLPDDMAGRLA